MDADAGFAWERLRASRWEPPGRAGGGSRRKTFASALEQAEQMFRAAVVVGPSTRPLQVFYGLSQAGRAIAAAAWQLKGEGWRLESHGIKATGFHKAFADIEVRTDPPTSQGSFVRLSELLQSPVWEKTPVRLESLWDTLPVNLKHPLTEGKRVTPLFADHESVYGEDHPLVSVPVCDLPAHVLDAGDRLALDDYLSAFPKAAGYDDYARASTEPDAPPDFRRYRNGRGQLQIHWRMPHGTATAAERTEHLRSMTRTYLGNTYFFPVIAPLSRELHPLMAWWAVLYVLSMLARYEPAIWAAHISIDGSRHAVPIERLLERAVAELPTVIADTLDDVAAR
ncbi:YaaC family protein [Streptomyces netropsis]|uniref:YaaC family protein n=1 Tax=Streptomyces netropsis TaxID=55404 RepID=UPI0037AE69D0